MSIIQPQYDPYFFPYGYPTDPNWDEYATPYMDPRINPVSGRPTEIVGGGGYGNGYEDQGAGFDIYFDPTSGQFVSMASGAVVPFAQIPPEIQQEAIESGLGPSGGGNPGGTPGGGGGQPSWWDQWFESRYGTHIPTPYYNYTNTSDPNEMILQARESAQAWGDATDQAARDAANRYQNLEGSFLRWGMTGPGGYSDILTGQGGYDDEEQRNLLQRELLESGMMTQDDLNNQYLTAQEMASILGDPYAARDIQNYEGLGLSDQFYGDYRFGPREEQDIVDSAARTVGAGTQARQDETARRYSASGIYNPLALTAAQNRTAHMGDVAAADAMTDARIGARQLRLNTAANLENMRLGTERDIGTRLYEGTRYGEGESSRRWGDVAGNRQQIGRYGVDTRWGQAMPASQALSSRYGGIYGQKKDEEAEGRRYLTQQQGAAQEGAMGSFGQRINIGATRFGAQGQPLGASVQLRSIPGLWERLAAAGAGAASALAGD